MPLYLIIVHRTTKRSEIEISLGAFLYRSEPKGSPNLYSRGAFGLSVYIDNKLRKENEMIQKNSKIIEFSNEIRRLGRQYGLNVVFTTFLELMATSLASQTDPLNAEKRMKRYGEITADMPEELQGEYGKLCMMLFIAVNSCKEDPVDVLGTVYHELRLNNEWNGQYFTPDDVSRMMAMITFGAQKDNLSEEDVFTVNEPTCGSGTMLIAMAWAMLQENRDYTSKCLCVAQDIDIRCVWMAYIQLTLYRIPAVIIHGNTITMETWDQWFTPNYWAVARKGNENV